MKNGHLAIVIKDNGVGIHENTLKEIYESMNNLEELDHSHIGLSNVNQRIKLLYGTEYGLKIDTVKNRGTTVTIILPLKGE